MTNTEEKRGNNKKGGFTMKHTELNPEGLLWKATTLATIIYTLFLAAVVVVGIIFSAPVGSVAFFTVLFVLSCCSAVYFRRKTIKARKSN